MLTGDRLQKKHKGCHCLPPHMKMLVALIIIPGNSLNIAQTLQLFNRILLRLPVCYLLYVVRIDYCCLQIVMIAICYPIIVKIAHLLPIYPNTSSFVAQVLSCQYYR